MELSTERLRLRDAVRADAAALAAYQRDARYLSSYASPPDAARIVEQAIRWAEEHPRLDYQLIVERRGDGPPIGCAGLRRSGFPRGRAEIGIELAPDHWGVGYATEALSALIAFGVEHLAVEHLSAETRATNAAAVRLLHALHFTRVQGADKDDGDDRRVVLFERCLRV